MGQSHLRLWIHRARSVAEDWLAWMPAEKDGLFEATVAEFEAGYVMLSVALNESLAMKATGSLIQAREQAGVAASLCDRLAARLLAVIRALEDHGRHFGTLPNVAPLDVKFFRGMTAQHLARKNSLLSKVLLSARSKFFHKLQGLMETLEELRGEFCAAADELSEGFSIHPESQWRELDVLHFDLNTCLRETIVVLKSFLCALPNEEVQPLSQKLQPVVPAFPALRPRRAALFSRL